MVKLPELHLWEMHPLPGLGGPSFTWTGTQRLSSPIPLAFNSSSPVRPWVRSLGVCFYRQISQHLGFEPKLMEEKK